MLSLISVYTGITGFFRKYKADPQAVRLHIFRLDIAAMLFDDMFGQGQSQTCSRLVTAAVRTVKSGENMRQLVFSHTGAVIGNIHQPIFRILLHMDFDGAAFGAVIHGIADYVVKCAVEVAFIGQYFGIFGHFFYHQIDDLAVLDRKSVV